MQDKLVALVTGANKGIGLQIAKDFAARGLTVLVGSRKLAQGETAAQGIGAAAHAIQIDVTDQASIAAAAERIRREFGRLDVLVKNAGIADSGGPGRSSTEIAASNTPSLASLDEVRAVFETNVFGVIATTQALLPLLREAPAGRIVNAGSSSGSLTLNADPTYPHRAVFGAAYSPSKTALHAITLAFASELASTNIRVNAACPGFTATDLNHFRGTLHHRTGRTCGRPPRAHRCGRTNRHVVGRGWPGPVVILSRVQERREHRPPHPGPPALTTRRRRHRDLPW